MQPATSTTLNPTDVAPPWKLSGSGWILFYRFSPDFVAQHGFLPPYLQGAFRGGVGAVLLLDFHTSPVGAYQELLFAPGVFRVGKRRYRPVTKIYTSSAESAASGRTYWGLPKEHADFTVTQVDDVTQQFAVSLQGYTFFDATLREGVLRFPVNTSIVPKRFSPWLLQQRNDGMFVRTSPYAAGVVGPAGELQTLTVDGRGFPDVSGLQPVGVVQAVTLRLTLPIPQEVTLDA